MPLPLQRHDAAIAAALGLLVFAVRWLILDFDNEYFMHVAWAAEMIRGGRPVYDFVEPGFILQTTIAYLAMLAGGPQLAVEGVLVCALLATATVATFLVCRSLGIPRWMAVVASLAAAATCPRLYAYPKVLVYPLAILAIVSYARHPSRRWLVALAAMTAISFLFRHDHGVYVGVYMSLSLIALHLGGSRSAPLARSLREYAALSLLMISPWVAWVALSGHAGQYVDFLVGRSDSMAETYLPHPRLSFDTSQPLITIGQTTFPDVKLRWTASVAPEQRRALESTFGMIPIEEPGIDRTGRYRLTTVDRRTMQTVVEHPAVEDTQGIDRRTFLAPASWTAWLWLKLSEHMPLVRLRVLPGYIHSGNAMAWLNYVFLGIPIAVLLAWILASPRDPVERTNRIVMTTTAILAVILYQRLVRESLDSRLGDVAHVEAILLAWVAWQAWKVRTPAAAVLRPVAVIVLVFTLGSAVAFGGSIRRLADAGVAGPATAIRRAADVADRYRQTPLDIYAPPGTTGLPGLSRWLNACTRDSDRIVVVGFEPQIHVVADRSFGGGLAFYDTSWSSSDADQRLVLARWSAQNVPVVLALNSEWNAFSRDYPLVRAFLDERYRVWAESEFGGTKAVKIFVRADHPAEGRSSDGLPCFAQVPADGVAPAR